MRHTYIYIFIHTYNLSFLLYFFLFNASLKETMNCTGSCDEEDAVFQRVALDDNLMYMTRQLILSLRALALQNMRTHQDFRLVIWRSSRNSIHFLALGIRPSRDSTLGLRLSVFRIRGAIPLLLFY